jgi:tubulin beta
VDLIAHLRYFLSLQFWEVISDEHHIDLTGNYSDDTNLQFGLADTYYNEESSGRHVPRAILVDLERDTLDSIRSGPLCDLLRRDNFVLAESNTSNNWAEGHYQEGVYLIDHVMDVLRREVERCDCLEGFQLTHSLSGGTGSGMGSLIMSRIKEEYQNKIMCAYSVAPARTISPRILDPYNAVLTIDQLIENSRLTYCFENEALYDICYRRLYFANPTYDDLNRLVSRTMSGATTYLRFPEVLEEGLHAFSAIMAPVGPLHFLLPGLAPLTPPLQALTVQELTRQISCGNNMMAVCDPRDDVHISHAFIFQGYMTCLEVYQHMNHLNYQPYKRFYPGEHTVFGLCNTPFRGIETSVTYIGNTSAIVELFRRILAQFTRLFRRRDYMQYYTALGMEESDFTMAASNVDALVSGYEGVPLMWPDCV